MMYYYLLLIAVYVLRFVHSETIETGTAEAALQCNLCVDRFNWTHCDEAAKPKECSTELVDATHNFLAQYSPELNNTRSGGRQFRCFRLELEIDVSSVNVFIRGCTYDDTTFCDGWSANGAKAINCAICSTGVCERNATWDVIPETTTGATPAANTFNCTECVSDESWEHCRNHSWVAQCTAADVNELHSSLRQFNPNLPVGNYSEFKCFSMKANFSDPEYGGVEYHMGCTFASARFCTRSEWHNATIMECSGASLLNAESVTGLAIVATFMMFVCQLKVKWC